MSHVDIIVETERGAEAKATWSDGLVTTYPLYPL